MYVICSAAVCMYIMPRVRWVMEFFACGYRIRGCFPKFANDKWPFYDYFWSFFWQLHKYLSQKLGADSHFGGAQPV